MTIAEIKELEANRKGMFNVVHWEKEGNFYHANDWSAWLMTKYPIGEAAVKPMIITAKKLKDGYIHVFVGFPATSIEKYIPNDGSVKFEPKTDNQIDVSLNVDFGNTTEEEIRKMVDEWKLTLPITDTKKQNRENNTITENVPRITRLSDIAIRVISLPLEEISPKEAYDILRDLRKQISAIF